MFVEKLGCMEGFECLEDLGVRMILGSGRSYEWKVLDVWMVLDVWKVCDVLKI